MKARPGALRLLDLAEAVVQRVAGAARKAGSIPGYSYSEANKASGITWTEGAFTNYIKDPQQAIKGTKMPLPASRANRRSTTSSPTSSPSTKTVKRNSRPAISFSKSPCQDSRAFRARPRFPFARYSGR
jgi:hypothetical protein